jgi:hypothetical protein
LPLLVSSNPMVAHADRFLQISSAEEKATRYNRS